MAAGSVLAGERMIEDQMRSVEAFEGFVYYRYYIWTQHSDSNFGMAA